MKDRYEREEMSVQEECRIFVFGILQVSYSVFGVTKELSGQMWELNTSRR